MTSECLTAPDAIVLQAFHAWLVLYRQPDVWRDPRKRRRMLDARRAYQDALLICQGARAPLRGRTACATPARPRRTHPA